MDNSTLFTIANTIVLPMWLLMIFLPNWKLTRLLIDYKIIPIILSAGYAITITTSILSGGGMDFGSLESVMQLFTKEDAVLAGWVHYLAFDLLIGMWMLKQNEQLKINIFLMALCLLFTFMLGPVGFLLFTIVSKIKK